MGVSGRRGSGEAAELIRLYCKRGVAVDAHLDVCCAQGCRDGGACAKRLRAWAAYEGALHGLCLSNTRPCDEAGALLYGHKRYSAREEAHLNSKVPVRNIQYHHVYSL